MMEIPTGESGMGMSQALKLARDAGSAEFSHHPAQYMFKDAPAEMGKQLDLDAVVAMMDQFGVESTFLTFLPNQVEKAIAIFERFPGRFYGEVGVNPHLGMRGVRRLEETIKAHPNFKAASAAACLLNPQAPLDDKVFYPIYAKCCELEIPINLLVGVPGPRVPYKVQYPGLLDEVAWFFPELTIVMRHGGEPWADLCAKLMLKWPNLYFSTTAFAPKYYPKEIMDFANTRGSDKVMFSGYYPALSYERIFGELDNLGLREEVWPKFLSENARRVYKLPPSGAAAGSTPGSSREERPGA
ncbi:MAG: amidohydrolase [Caulobacteraceae bacterium]|nr:amidohydrolase [Caulobacteraceae bacterium]